jgi:hydrogenase expression/formation protein HypE
MNKSMFSAGLDCPAPRFDFDVITLGHGSGGLLTRRLLDAGVFQVLQNEYLDEGHDGAFLTLEGRTAFTTDSFVVSPILFPGGNIGELAVNGTVNDLAMCGARPRFLSLSFILEEGLKMTEFAEVLLGIQRACRASGVQVVTGDTKVVEKGKGDKIFINTTGIGSIHSRADIRAANIKKGDAVLVSGPIATHGIAILSVRQGLEFETSLVSDTTNLNHLVWRLLDDFGGAIHFLRDPTRGGVASTLNEITRPAGLGIRLWQKALPLEEGVESACELLGLDPLYVANEGVFIAIVAREQAAGILEAMNRDEKGRHAALIGEVTDEHPGQVVLQSAIGGRRVVNMLAGEQLPRIC